MVDFGPWRVGVSRAAECGLRSAEERRKPERRSPEVGAEDGEESWSLERTPLRGDPAGGPAASHSPGLPSAEARRLELGGREELTAEDGDVGRRPGPKRGDPAGGPRAGEEICLLGAGGGGPSHRGRSRRRRVLPSWSRRPEVGGSEPRRSRGRRVDEERWSGAASLRVCRERRTGDWEFGIWEKVHWFTYKKKITGGRVAGQRLR